MKKFVVLFLLLLPLFAFSESKRIEYEDFTFTAFYRQNLQPGDPVFLRLEFETYKKKFIKKFKANFIEAGNLEVYRLLDEGKLAEKATAKSKFYNIEKNVEKKHVKSVLLTAVPLSTWAKLGDYVAKIEFVAFERRGVVEIPFKICEKEFISETIPLNASNTKIRTNTSSERMDQIKRLNAILDTKNYDAVYETSSFAPPTPATRRTSFFGDRRVFAYSNGKSSTSLHYGIDYGVPSGSEVRSCGRGRVVMAEDRITTGWSVCIEHLPGLYSLYYHMSQLDVQLGQMVEKGELLGLSGATGLATGPHLHWEIRLNMEAINPDFMTEDFAFSVQE